VLVTTPARSALPGLDQHITTTTTTTSTTVTVTVVVGF